ncbi:hypothetical protein BMR61_23555 [Escherichia coli]|nr:hypothetical protein BMR61_23555 [Escherichia coli]
MIWPISLPVLLLFSF